MKNTGFFVNGLFYSVLICLWGLTSCSKSSNENTTSWDVWGNGGMTITMEIDVPDILDALSGYNTSYKYKEAMAAAQDELKCGSSENFLTLFFNEYEKDGGQLAPLFAGTMRDIINPDMSNSVVKDILRCEVEAATVNSFNVLRTRIDHFGVAQPNIQRLGSNRIMMALPDVHDQQRIAKLMQSEGNLEFWETYNYDEIYESLTEVEANLAEENRSLFHLFLSQGQPGMPLVGVSPYSDTAKINRILARPSTRRLLPPNARFYWGAKAIDENNTYFQLIALKAQRGGRPSLEGDFITDARVDIGDYGSRPEILIKMNSTGARKWECFTQENIGRCIAIVLDSRVYNYPKVLSAISGGNSSILGNFTEDEANDLANILKSGKMAAPVRILNMEEINMEEK